MTGKEPPKQDKKDTPDDRDEEEPAERGRSPTRNKTEGTRKRRSNEEKEPERNPKIIYSSKKTTAKTTQKKIADPPITDEKAKIKALGRIPKKKTMNSSPNSDSKYALELTADDPIEAPTVNDHPDNNFQPLGDTIRKNRNKKDDIHKILERKLEEEGIEGAKNNHADHNNESSRMEIDEIEIDIVEEIKVKTEDEDGYCLICSNVPGSNGKTKMIKHKKGHVSTKQHRLAQKMDDKGRHYCATCKTKHKDDMDRLCVVVGNSTLQDLHKQIKKGKHIGKHFDLSLVHNATLDEAKQQITAEYKDEERPIDLLLVAPGIHDLENGESTDNVIDKIKEIKQLMLGWNENNTVGIGDLPYPPSMSKIYAASATHFETHTPRTEKSIEIKKVNVAISRLNNQRNEKGTNTRRAPGLALCGLKFSHGYSKIDPAPGEKKKKIIVPFNTLRGRFQKPTLKSAIHHIGSEWSANPHKHLTVSPNTPNKSTYYFAIMNYFNSITNPDNLDSDLELEDPDDIFEVNHSAQAQGSSRHRDNYNYNHEPRNDYPGQGQRRNQTPAHQQQHTHRQPVQQQQHMFQQQQRPLPPQQQLNKTQNFFNQNQSRDHQSKQYETRHEPRDRTPHNSGSSGYVSSRPVSRNSARDEPAAHIDKDDDEQNEANIMTQIQNNDQAKNNKSTNSGQKRAADESLTKKNTKQVKKRKQKESSSDSSDSSSSSEGPSDEKPEVAQKKGMKLINRINKEKSALKTKLKIAEVNIENKDRQIEELKERIKEQNRELESKRQQDIKNIIEENNKYVEKKIKDQLLQTMQQKPVLSSPPRTVITVSGNADRAEHMTTQELMHAKTHIIEEKIIEEDYTDEPIDEENITDNNVEELEGSNNKQQERKDLRNKIPKNIQDNKRPSNWIDEQRKQLDEQSRIQREKENQIQLQQQQLKQQQEILAQQYEFNRRQQQVMPPVDVRQRLNWRPVENRNEFNPVSDELYNTFYDNRDRRFYPDRQNLYYSSTPANANSPRLRIPDRYSPTDLRQPNDRYGSEHDSNRQDSSRDRNRSSSDNRSNSGSRDRSRDRSKPKKHQNK